MAWVSIRSRRKATGEHHHLTTIGDTKMFQSAPAAKRRENINIPDVGLKITVSIRSRRKATGELPQTKFPGIIREFQSAPAAKRRENAL